MILPDGKKYVGKWKDGRPWDGIGYKKNEEIEFRVVDGKRYVGNKVKRKENVLYRGVRSGEIGWYEEKWEGLVSKENDNHGMYEGEIKNGLPNGYGKETYPGGSMFVGEWNDGWEWNGTGYNKDGTIRYKYVNGEWFKQ